MTLDFIIGGVFDEYIGYGYLLFYGLEDFMKTSRQEALSNAYFIRSVLSKISDNFDKVQEKENEAASEGSFDFEKYITENSDEELVVEYKENSKKISNINARVEEQGKETDEKLKTLLNVLAEKKIKQSKVKRSNLIIFAIDILLSATILILNLLNKSIIEALIGFAVVNCFFITNIIIKLEIARKIKFLNKEITHLTQKKSEILASNNANDIIILANRNQEIKRALFYKSKSEEKERQKRMKEERIKEKESCIAITGELYSILKCNFQTFLDERDWQHLDIIIYELETGRADTIKEALQQADLYIRHAEIKGMMASATNAVCATIRESIGELSQSLGTSLERLHSEISEMNQASRELASNLTAKVDDLVNAQELSNALLKKSNISSAQLAEDVHRMRLLRDDEYYRS